MFALVDCNNFYASCERVFQPELRYQPLVILSNNDGCVIARSNEAKTLGIPMGAPAFKFKETFKRLNIAVRSSNYELYGDMSARVMNILSEFTPDVEVYSIDEAFLAFNGFERINLQQHLEQMKLKVERCTGIPISIGVAPTKSLSKLANRIAKKFPKHTDGVYIMHSEEQRIKALKWLDIKDIWGIGKQHAKRLQQLGLQKAYEFTQLPDDWTRKHMSVVGLRLKKELEGEVTLGLDDVTHKKAIATTRSFDYEYNDFDYIKERVTSFAVSCGEKLRRQESCCELIYVFLKSNRFNTNAPQYSNGITIKTTQPTNSSISLVKYATTALRAIYRPEYKYKKAGVMVMGLSPEKSKQICLFSEEDPRHHKLMQHIDQLNSHWGKHSVKFGGQDLQKIWKMRQEHLSKAYTTKLKDVIKVS